MKTLPTTANGCIECLSTRKLLDHGEAMREHGWKVIYGTDGNGNTIYQWHSPRDEVYTSYAANVPSQQAVSDAVSHNDYSCQP